MKGNSKEYRSAIKKYKKLEKSEDIKEKDLRPLGLSTARRNALSVSRTNKILTIEQGQC